MGLGEAAILQKPSSDLGFRFMVRLRHPEPEALNRGESFVEFRLGFRRWGGGHRS